MATESQALIVTGEEAQLLLGAWSLYVAVGCEEGDNEAILRARCLERFAAGDPSPEGVINVLSRKLKALVTHAYGHQ